jgi:hypothetical protein
VTAAASLAPEPRLSWHEGEALRVAEGLVGKGRAAPPDGVPLEEPSPALATAVARTFAAACGRFVIEHGARARTVLRDGRRVEGRIWDARLNEGFALTLTKDADALWWRSVKDLLPLAAKKRQRVNADTIDNTREDKRILRAAVPMLTHGSGDALVFLLAHEHASYLRLPRPLELAFQQALREASPLARLWAPDDAAPKGRSCASACRTR